MPEFTGDWAIDTFLVAVLAATVVVPFVLVAVFVALLRRSRRAATVFALASVLVIGALSGLTLLERGVSESSVDRRMNDRYAADLSNAFGVPAADITADHQYGDGFSATIDGETLRCGPVEHDEARDVSVGHCSFTGDPADYGLASGAFSLRDTWHYEIESTVVHPARGRSAS